MDENKEINGIICLIPHSRIYPLSEKCSTVWKQIGQGFESFFKKFYPYILFLVLSIRKNYNDIEEYINLVEDVISTKNSNIIVLPLTPRMGKYENRLLDILKRFKGQIVAINVPPNLKAKRALGKKLRGYVGPNEVEFGKMAGKILFACGKIIDCIYVLCDKPQHYGYSLRIKGLKVIAKKFGIPVCVIDINDAKKSRVICEMMENNSAFVSLGIIGTEFALEMQKKYPNKISAIIAIDLDKKVAENIKNGNILCTLIQDPIGQGYKAAELATSILKQKTSAPYTEIFCGPEVVNLNNISQYE